MSLFFRVDISSSLRIDNKGKYISVLGVGPTQGLDDTTLEAKAKYSINFSKPKKILCLSLYYNESYSF